MSAQWLTSPPGLGPQPLPRTWRSGVLAASVGFVLACVLPSIIFVIAAYRDDETATHTAGDLAAYLIAYEVAIGLVIAAVLWGFGWIRSVVLRRILTGLGLGGAVVWGLVT